MLFTENIKGRESDPEKKEMQKMALNKEFLTALGIDKTNIDEIMNAHGEVVSYWKGEAKKYKAEADKLPTVQGELDKLKEAAEKGNPFEKKYNDLKAEYDSYKADVTAKETKAAKEAAVKAYFESKHIVGNNLELALRGSKDETAAIEIVDGKIKDTSVLDGLISGTFAGLVSKSETRGANTPTPLTNTSGNVKTKEEIMQIKDTTERQRAWGEYLMSNQQKGS